MAFWAHVTELRDEPVEYRPAYFDDNLSVKLDVFNVFNFQEALVRQEFSTDASGDPEWSYGSDRFYLRPRSVRLGLNYNFGL